MEKIERNIKIQDERLESRELLIEVKDLVKIYHQGWVEVFALRGINAEFHRGEIAVIEGPSGCGKSTFVNILGGLDRPSAGEVYFYQNPGVTSDLKAETDENHRISLSELTDAKMESLSWKKNWDRVPIHEFNSYIDCVRKRAITTVVPKYKSPKERKKRAEELLRQTKIIERAKHKPSQLSGGEQQRVAIAVALINNPSIIIADEPTGNLDTNTAESIIDLFKSIKENFPDKTIIIVSHDRAFRRIADRILFIKDGVIIDEQVPDQVVNNADNFSPEALDEIQKYQQRVMELERRLNQMENIFKE